MINARNNITIIGGLTADPEVIDVGSSKAAKFRVAVDFSGRDSTAPDNRTGYFNVTKYLNDDPNSRFIATQISEGKLKKGSQLAIVGSIEQNRWKDKDGSGRERVEIVAESMTYVGGRRDDDAKTPTTTATTATATANDDGLDIPSSF